MCAGAARRRFALRGFPRYDEFGPRSRSPALQLRSAARSGVRARLVALSQRVLFGEAPGGVSAIVELRTERLLLRAWSASDLVAFAELNADPEVMEHFPSPLTRDESDALAERIQAGFAERGWGPWAVEVPGAAEFAGFVGLSVPSFESHFTPCVEVGWRLAKRHWGRGFATEAARAAIAFGFGRLRLREIVSFTAACNARSRRVMERLGMERAEADDFEHPALPDGHRLRRHVLYRLSRRDDVNAARS